MTAIAQDGIILASASPRRKQLLEQIGLQFSIEPSQADETIDPAETPEQAVCRLSLAKAQEICAATQSSARWIIGSDTIVVRSGMILGKPRDREHARSMLRQLSGAEHQVVSGIAIIDRLDGQQFVEAVSTRVRFRKLSADEIDRYIATGEADDKAGAYAIQGLGVCFVAGIEGSYSNVVGLPLCRLTLALKEMGVPLKI